MGNKGPQSQGDTPDRYRSLWRVPGILFATAALVVAFSGVHAWDTASVVDRAKPAPQAPAQDPAPEVATTTLLRAADTPSASMGTPSEPVLSRTLPFATGHVLDDEDRALFEAHIAAMKERGAHRGPMFYTSW